MIVNAPLSDYSEFDNFIKNNSFIYQQKEFNSKTWTLSHPQQLKVKEKIEQLGITLEKLNTKIRLGLATGANEAFVIDETQKKELIAKDKSNKNIIKPLLRGRDIQRFTYDKPEKYIILSK